MGKSTCTTLSLPVTVGHFIYSEIQQALVSTTSNHHKGVKLKKLVFWILVIGIVGFVAYRVRNVLRYWAKKLFKSTFGYLDRVNKDYGQLLEEADTNTEEDES